MEKREVRDINKDGEQEKERKQKGRSKRRTNQEGFKREICSIREGKRRPEGREEQEI